MSSANGSAEADFRTYQTIVHVCNSYIFPVQFVAGVFGNLINLVVLLSRGMRCRSGHLLAAMAGSDILFFVFMGVLNSLSVDFVWSTTTKIWLFRHFHDFFLATANWFSIASCWFVLAVSVFRLIGVTLPLRAGQIWTTARFTSLFLILWSASFVLTVGYNFTHKIHVVNKTVMRDEQMTTEQRPEAKAVWPSLHSFLRQTQMIFGVILPCAALVVVNAMLVHSLRKHRLYPLLLPRLGVLICTTYKDAISNSLVSTGKVLNFVLFCTSSTRFRTALKQLLCKPAAPLLSRLTTRGLTTVNTSYGRRSTTLTATQTVKLDHDDIELQRPLQRGHRHTVTGNDLRLQTRRVTVV